MHIIADILIILNMWRSADCGGLRTQCLLSLLEVLQSICVSCSMPFNAYIKGQEQLTQNLKKNHLIRSFTGVEFIKKQITNVNAMGLCSQLPRK